MTLAYFLAGMVILLRVLFYYFIPTFVTVYLKKNFFSVKSLPFNLAYLNIFQKCFLKLYVDGYINILSDAYFCFYIDVSRIFSGGSLVK